MGRSKSALILQRARAMLEIPCPLAGTLEQCPPTTTVGDMHCGTTNSAHLHRNTMLDFHNRQQFLRKSHPMRISKPRITHNLLTRTHKAKTLEMPFKLGLIRKKSERAWIRQMRNNPAAAFPTKHKFVRELQDGAEGVVQAWTYEPSGTTVAVKVVKSKPDLPREVEFLMKLPEHQHIIRCLAYFDKQPAPENLAIVLEYCPGGDLYDFYWETAHARNGSIFSENFMWSAFTQLSSALAFLHEGIGAVGSHAADTWRPVVHRDIKFENVLVQTMGTKNDWSDIVLKLGDFGLSAYYDPADAKLPRGMGTTCSWAPEVTWSDPSITPAADVWGVGAVIHTLVHGFGPLVSDEETKSVWYEKNTGEPYPEYWSEPVKQSFWSALEPRNAIPINIDSEMHESDSRRRRPSPKYSNELNECMMMALEMDPEQRASAGELLQYIEEEQSSFLFRQLEIETKEDRALFEYKDEGHRFWG